jgi:hypothetical protein
MRKQYLSELELQKIVHDIKTILRGFSIEFEIEGIRSKSRDSNLVFIRALIVLILKNEKYNWFKIGQVINRDHATCINLYKYDSKNQCRDPRYDEIKHIISCGFTESDIKAKIKMNDIERKRLVEMLKTFKKRTNKLKLITENQ